MSTSTAPEFLTSRQAATLLGISYPHLMRLVTRGELPGAQVGVLWRFSRRQLVDWLESRALARMDPQAAARLRKVSHTRRLTITAGLALALVLSAARPTSAQPQVVLTAAQYLGQGNMTGNPGNWCASFVVHVYGVALPVEPTPSARQLWNRFRAAGLATTTPQPGDLIFFWRESPSSWKGHVGIVESASVDVITTIEGNVDGKVVRCTYRRRAIPRLLGFGRMP